MMRSPQFLSDIGRKSYLEILILLLYLFAIFKISGISYSIISNQSFEINSNEQVDNEKDEDSKSNSPLQPKTVYELLRRRIRSNNLELSNYIQFNLIQMKIKSPKNVKQIDKVISLSREHSNAITSDMDQMRVNDGYEDWRYYKARDLSELVQRRIEYLQNPENCGQAKKLICRITKWVYNTMNIV